MSVEVWGLSDLHLGPGAGKGHFSSSWKGHQSKLRASWDERIPDDALVLMPGDFSWHQTPEDLKYDYYWINDRPGFKVLSPGNHDYGVWTNHEEADEFVSQFDRMRAIYGRAIRLDNPVDPDGPGLVVFSTCGTAAPEDTYFNSNGGASSIGQDKEIIRFFRELALLEQALDEAAELQRDGDQLIAMFHYPPFADGTGDSVWSRAMERAGVDMCLYGHLHHTDQWRRTVQGEHNGVDYRFVGADFLDFKPTRVGEWGADGFRPAPIEVTSVSVSRPSTTAYGYDGYDDYDAWWGIPTGGTTASTNGNPTPASTLPQNASPSSPPAETVQATNLQSAPQLDGFYTDSDGTAMVDASEWSDIDAGEYRAADLQLDGSGRPMMCVACGQLVIKGEDWHAVDGGVVHGRGASSEEDTCAYVASSEPTESAVNASTADGTSSVGEAESLADSKMDKGLEADSGPKLDYARDEYGVARTCMNCREPIRLGEEWHGSARGPIHGAAGVDQPASCEDPKATNGPIAPAASSGRTSGSAEPLQTDDRPGHPIKTGMNCIGCGRRILKNEAWHNTAKGKIHGWGTYQNESSCTKVAATGWKPAGTPTASKPVGVRPITRQPLIGGWLGPQRYLSHRSSGLTAAEARQLDGWAEEYLLGAIDMDELRARSKPFASATVTSATSTTITSAPTRTAPTGFQLAGSPPLANSGWSDDEKSTSAGRP